MEQIKKAEQIETDEQEWNNTDVFLNICIVPFLFVQQALKLKIKWKSPGIDKLPNL